MLKANQICMIEYAYDAEGCAYLIGLQVALEACNFGKLKSLIFACIMLYGSKIIYGHIFEARCVINAVIHQIDTM